MRLLAPPGEHGPQPNLGARPEGIKWAQEGGWCVSLGVPLGNDLNEPRWWAAKIGSIRQKTTSWVGMYRTGYLERNLIVQGCYLGRMRYWVYSIGQNKYTVEVVQKDADVLWFSREPKIDDTPEGVKNPKSGT